VRPRERVGSKEMNINTTLAELHNEKGRGSCSGSLRTNGREGYLPAEGL